MRKPKSKKSGGRKGSKDGDGMRDRALSALIATSDLITVSGGVFLAFQDANAAAAADIEEAMELTPEERAREIKRLEAELRKAKMDLDELNEDLPANETTAKAKEANIAEIERELNALKIAKAVADQFPQGKNADEWRELLRNAIRTGQLDAFALVLNILTLPSFGAGLLRGLSSIRTIRGFFAWLFRSRPPASGPKQIPWNQYAEGYARRLDELKRVIRKEGRDLDEFERAVGRLQEWVDEYAPISPGPPR